MQLKKYRYKFGNNLFVMTRALERHLVNVFSMTIHNRVLLKQPVNDKGSVNMQKYFGCERKLFSHNTLLNRNLTFIVILYFFRLNEANGN